MVVHWNSCRLNPFAKSPRKVVKKGMLSAGSYAAMVLASVLKEPAFQQTLGATTVTAIAMPSSLMSRSYTNRRAVKFIHVQKDELYVWHPSEEDLQPLEANGITVTYIEGTIQWLGSSKHHYGHMVATDLPAGTFDIYSLLNYTGVLPNEERRKAAMRLMSWCTFRTPSSLRNLLNRLSAQIIQWREKDSFNLVYTWIAATYVGSSRCLSVLMWQICFSWQICIQSMVLFFSFYRAVSTRKKNVGQGWVKPQPKVIGSTLFFCRQRWKTHENACQTCCSMFLYCLHPWTFVQVFATWIIREKGWHVD